VVKQKHESKHKKSTREEVKMKTRFVSKYEINKKRKRKQRNKMTSENQNMKSQGKES